MAQLYPPGPRAPLVDDSGTITRPWLLYLEQLGTATGSGATSTGVPPQPGAGDWSIALIEYGYGDPLGQNRASVPVAHLRVTITCQLAGIAYYSVFGYPGAAAPTDPGLYGTGIDNQVASQSGSTVMDFWIPRPNADTTYWFVITASTANYQAFPSNVATSAAQSLLIQAVHAPDQPAALNVTLYRETRAGVDSGALAFWWPAPADLEYFGGKVYRCQTDSTYTLPHSTLSADIDASTLTIPITDTTHFVLSETGIKIGGEDIEIASIATGVITASQRGANGTTAAAHASGDAVDGMWDYIGVGMGAPNDPADGFDQRKLNGGTWWPLGPEAWFVFKVDSISRALDANGANIENTVSAPTATLHVPAGASSGAPGAPTQPGDSDWTVSVVRDDHNDQTGENTALCHALVNLAGADPDINVYVVYLYKGSSPPANAADWGDGAAAAAKATTGTQTEIFFRLSREQGSTGTYQVIVVARSTGYNAGPGDFSGTVKSITIDAVHVPPQVTGFSVTAVGPDDVGGVASGKLRYTFTVPNDAEIGFVNIYRVQTDSSYTPLGGLALGQIVAIGILPAMLGTTVTWTQPDYWPWLSGESWWHFEIRSWSRACGENTASAPTANLHMAATDGLNLAMAKLSSVGSGITISGGQIKVKYSPTSSGLAFDGSGNLTVNPSVGLTIDASGFLKVKTAGAVNTDGSGNIYIPGGAITNSLLAALSVANANLQDNSVTSTKIPSAAIGTAHIQSAAITTALIANAAITNALLGTAVVGTANIQTAAITDALIANCAVGKLTAGTATFTSDVTFTRSGGGSVVINGSGMVLKGSSGYGITIASDGGVTFQDNTGWSISISSHNISGAYNVSSVQVEASGTGGFVNAKNGAEYRVAGASSINQYNQFVGSGAAMKAACGATAFNITDSSGNYVYGGATERLYAQVWVPAPVSAWCWVLWGPYLGMTHAALELTGGLFRGYYA